VRWWDGKREREMGTDVENCATAAASSDELDVESVQCAEVDFFP